MEASQRLRSNAAAVAAWEQLRARAPTLAPVAVLALLTLGCLLPFLNKAFHIDDPVFLWPAQQIERDPLRPFDRQVNWYGYTEPLGSLTIHPPLVSYYMAAAARVAGWSEPALHGAFLLLAIGVVVGTYLLARRLCAH